MKIISSSLATRSTPKKANLQHGCSVRAGTKKIYQIDYRCLSCCIFLSKQNSNNSTSSITNATFDEQEMGKKYAADDVCHLCQAFS